MTGPTHILTRFGRSRRGGTAVEFALVAPIFLVCAFALFQVGFGIYSYATIAHIAQQGARHLLFAPSDEAGAREVMTNATAGTTLNSERLDIATQTMSSPYPHIELTLRYHYQPIGPFPLPQDIVLSSSALIPLSED